MIRSSLFKCAVLFTLTGITLTGCAGSSGSDTGPGPTLEVYSGRQSVKAKVGPAGAELALESGVRVSIPKDALKEEIEITVSEVAEDKVQDLPRVDKSRDVQKPVKLEPHGTKFEKAVDIELPVPDMYRKTPEKELSVVVLDDEKDATWGEVKTAEPVKSGRAKIKSDHFSFYAIVPRSPSSGTDGDGGASEDGGSGGGAQDAGGSDAAPPAPVSLSIEASGCKLDGQDCPSAWIEAQDAGTYLVKSTLVADVIYVGSGVVLTAAPWSSAAGDSSGAIRMEALGGTITIADGARLDVSGLGYGGGGGGGGNVYGDSAYCPDDSQSAGGLEGGPADGEVPSAAPPLGSAGMCVVPGGRGGGYGGAPGSAGGRSVIGLGGAGAGPAGGLGGPLPTASGQDKGADGTPGRPGGYRAAGTNGDDAADADDNIDRGSGGGGGSAAYGSGGFCQGPGRAGAGGRAAPAPVTSCTSGGGGAGGAAGGGLLLLRANTIDVGGTLKANGAGEAAAAGGYGAGGGILLSATGSVTLAQTALLESLGGALDGVGTTTNGGTVKLRGPQIVAPEPIGSVIAAGRVSRTP